MTEAENVRLGAFEEGFRWRSSSGGRDGDGFCSAVVQTEQFSELRFEERQRGEPTDV